MDGAKGLLRAVDHWQQGNRFLAIAYAVVREFGDDEGNLFVVALGWYGFTAVYPLLLVVVTIFGYIGVESLGTGIVSTLHQFRVVGAPRFIRRGPRAVRVEPGRGPAARIS